MAAYLQRLSKAKGNFEDGRLMYVAATRAKQRLHLLGHVGFQEQDGMARAKRAAPRFPFGTPVACGGK